ALPPLALHDALPIFTKHDLQKLAFLLPYLMLFVSYLMISPIRYPSFKTLDWQTRIRFRNFVFLLAVIGFVYFSREYALVIIFLAYLLWGVFRHIGRRRSSSKAASGAA